MIIVDRKTFLKLPKKTLYCKYDHPGNFGSLEIKESDVSDNWGNDWEHSSLNMFLKEPYDNIDKEFEITVGTELEFDFDVWSRDGLYENEQLFAILNNDDIKKMIDKLSSCIK